MMLEKRLELSSDIDRIKEKILINNKKIVEKTLAINDISEENIDVEFLINSLNVEERRILELRYKYDQTFLLMSRDLKMSESSVSRKVDKIVDKINKDIKNLQN